MTLPLENQVTSREISEELKKRGVPQDALFCHGYVDGEYEILLKEKMYVGDYEFCDAYTVSEIASMLEKGSDSEYFSCEAMKPDILAKNLLRCIDSGFIHVRDL